MTMANLVRSYSKGRSAHARWNHEAAQTRCPDPECDHKGMNYDLVRGYVVMTCPICGEVAGEFDMFEENEAAVRY